jgi:hypothetical protein
MGGKDGWAAIIFTRSTPHHHNEMRTTRLRRVVRVYLE